MLGILLGLRVAFAGEREGDAILGRQRFCFTFHAANFSRPAAAVNKTNFPSSATTLTLGARPLLVLPGPDAVQGGALRPLIFRDQRVYMGLERAPNLRIARAPELAEQVHEVQGDVARVHPGNDVTRILALHERIKHSRVPGAAGSAGLPGSLPHFLMRRIFYAADLLQSGDGSRLPASPRWTMLSRDDCLRFAKECEEMSKVARHAENRERLVEMAAAWRALAKMAEEPPASPRPRH